MATRNKRRGKGAEGFRDDGGEVQYSLTSLQRKGTLEEAFFYVKSAVPGASEQTLVHAWFHFHLRKQGFWETRARARFVGTELVELVTARLTGVSDTYDLFMVAGEFFSVENIAYDEIDFAQHERIDEMLYRVFVGPAKADLAFEMLPDTKRSFKRRGVGLYVAESDCFDRKIVEAFYPFMVFFWELSK